MLSQVREKRKEREKERGREREREKKREREKERERHRERERERESTALLMPFMWFGDLQNLHFCMVLTRPWEPYPHVDSIIECSVTSLSFYPQS